MIPAPLWIVVPSKGPFRGKSRLAPVLAPRRRAELVACLARRTLGCACAVASPERVVLVSESPDLARTARTMGASALADRGDDMNAAIALAARLIPAEADLLVLPADLPLLRPRDLRALLDAPAGCVIAPDERGEGTNALLWRRGAARIFAFGPGSFAAHRDAASRQGIAAAIVRRPGLAFDLDLPEHLDRLAAASEPREGEGSARSVVGRGSASVIARRSIGAPPPAAPVLDGCSPE